MLTQEQALTVHDIHANGCTRTVGPRGGVKTHIEQYRRASRTKLWKRSPERWEFKVKYGFSSRTYSVNETNVHEFHALTDCPLRSES